MSKQRVIDETQILQMHEGQARQLLNMWQDGFIDLDVGKERHDHTIETALQELTEILDRSIRTRNKQVEQDDDPRLEHGYFADPDR